MKRECLASLLSVLISTNCYPCIEKKSDLKYHEFIS